MMLNTKKRTKIVATIGPVSESEEMLEKFMLSGVNIFRLNLKHNTHDWHADIIKKIRSLSQKHKVYPGIMLDIQGPELRIGQFETEDGKVQLNLNQDVIFTTNTTSTGTPNTNNLIEIPFPKLTDLTDIKNAKFVYIDDGKVEIEITEFTTDNKPKGKVIRAGNLGSKKSVSIPGIEIDIPTLTEKDELDIQFGVKQDVDFFALSFVKNETDITTLRQYITSLEGKQGIVAKIETELALKNIDNIIKETDSLMVARGDLGVEIPAEKIPTIQKMLIKKCREAGKSVIVATQMLLSMVTNPTPSRAEIADIANSVIDLTDAVMLSEETTAGVFPLETVKAMARIAEYNEEYAAKNTNSDLNLEFENLQGLLLTSAVTFEKADLGVKGYIVFTESGRSVRELARYRPHLPIYAFSSHQEVCGQMAMSFGAFPIHMQLDLDPIKNINNAIKILKEYGFIVDNDQVVAIFGNNVGIPQANNAMSIVKC